MKTTVIHLTSDHSAKYREREVLRLGFDENVSSGMKYLPPVTSHMGSIGDISEGTSARGSLSTEGVPASRSTKEKRR